MKLIFLLLAICVLSGCANNQSKWQEREDRFHSKMHRVFDKLEH